MSHILQLAKNTNRHGGVLNGRDHVIGQSLTNVKDYFAT